MVVWSEMSKWHEISSYDLEVMSSNSGLVELGVHSPPVQTAHIVLALDCYIMQISSRITCGRVLDCEL